MLQQTRQEIEKCNKDYLEIKSAKHEMDQKIKEYRLYEVKHLYIEKLTKHVIIRFILFLELLK